jgi:hypothetical protein
MSEYPWKRVGRKEYAMMEGPYKGFRFEVSVPPFLYWLISPHDPEWLWVAFLHDADLELLKTHPIKAARRMKKSMEYWLTKRRWLIWPTYVAVLLWTTVGYYLRKPKGRIYVQ